MDKPIAGTADLTTFYKNPEDAPTVAKLAERNEDKQFSLKISSITDFNHDTIIIRM